MTDFGHDPSDVYNMEGTPTSFEEAKATVDSGEGDGLGITLSRHDEFLVFEGVGFDPINDGVPDVVRQLLNTLGDTFVEIREGDDGIRAVFMGLDDEILPDDGVFSMSIDANGETIAVRLYDRGWTPMTGRHVDGTPTDTGEVDNNGLTTVLELIQKHGNGE